MIEQQKGTEPKISEDAVKVKEEVSESVGGITLKEFIGDDKVLEAPSIGDVGVEKEFLLKQQIIDSENVIKQEYERSLVGHGVFDEDPPVDEIFDVMKRFDNIFESRMQELRSADLSSNVSSSDHGEKHENEAIAQLKREHKIVVERVRLECQRNVETCMEKLSEFAASSSARISKLELELNSANLQNSFLAREYDKVVEAANKAKFSMLESELGSQISATPIAARSPEHVRVPEYREQVASMVRGSELRSLDPMPQFNVNSPARSTMLFVDWHQKQSSSVSSAWPWSDVGERVWDREFEHACESQLQYGNLGQQKSQYIYRKCEFPDAVEQTISVRLHNLVMNAVPVNVRNEIFELHSTFKDTRGKDIRTLGGVFFVVLKNIFSGTGSQTTALISAVTNPQIPRSATEVVAAISTWRRLLVLLSKFNISLPDLCTLVPVLQSLYKPASDANNTLSWHLNDLAKEQDLMNTVSGPLTLERIYSFIDGVLGHIMTICSPGATPSRSERAAVARAKEVRKNRGNLEKNHSSIFAESPARGFKI